MKCLSMFGGFWTFTGGRAAGGPGHQQTENIGNRQRDLRRIKHRK